MDPTKLITHCYMNHDNRTAKIMVNNKTHLIEQLPKQNHKTPCVCVPIFLQ